MSRNAIRPLIGLTACRLFGAHGLPLHKVNESYIEGVMEGADGLPVLLPAMAERFDEVALDGLLASIDGLFATGSPSNVDPSHYDGEHARRDSERDPARDRTTLPLLRRAVERAVPLLAVCRGIQELNVAFGGTLHQHVHEVPGRMDHRYDQGMPIEDSFEQMAHDVTLREGGVLQAILEGASTVEVNTLHGQAIDRPGERIIIEAEAPDGTIEAVSVKDATSFALGVQWHPEWKVLNDPPSTKLFRAFGEACRMRAQQRTAGII